MLKQDRKSYLYVSLFHSPNINFLWYGGTNIFLFRPTIWVDIKIGNM